MLKKLRLKCENLMMLIPSNLYIHSNETHETITFSKLTIPAFLSCYMEDAVEQLLTKKKSLSEETYKGNQVYLYVDPFKMSYLTWPMIDSNSNHHLITLGPIITEHLTSEEIRYIGYKMKLSSDNCFILESFYGLVPYFDPLQIERIASMFLDYLTVEPHLPQIIREDQATVFPDDSKLLTNKFETFDFVEHNYAIEAKFLKGIENGDTDNLNNILKEFHNTFSMPPRYPSDPLREQKNMCITLNSISLRAAIKGGLNASIAHSLSHNFAITIEQQTSVEALNELTEKIILTYAESVRKYAMKGYSDTVTDAVTYIRTHLTEKVTLSEIAEHLYLTCEHLSRQFKKEMQMTVTDYIHKIKIEESCNLLTSGKFSISDIAYTFGYSSPPHYSKVFKQFMGLSPKQWIKEQNSNEI